MVWGFFLKLIPVPEEKRYKGDVDDDYIEEKEKSNNEHKSLLAKD